MAKQKIGIQANLFVHPTSGCKLPRFDARSTSEVDATRAPGNGKPFRNRKQKEMARTEAKKITAGKYKGTFVSHAPRQYRDMVPKQAPRTGGIHIG